MVGLKHFQEFKTDVTDVKLPSKFTFPFYYEPSEIAKIAVKEVQDFLETLAANSHNVGVSFNEDKEAIGKMFGVLIVKNHQHRIGYLAAYSGKLVSEETSNIFVPPVVPLSNHERFYEPEKEEIDALNTTIAALKNNPEYLQQKKEIEKLEKQINSELDFQKQRLKRLKKDRSTLKKEQKKILSDKDFETLSKKLAQESLNQQFFYDELQDYYKMKLRHQQGLIPIAEKIDALITLRKEKSVALRKTLYQEYRFLNKKKEEKSLAHIFELSSEKPPAGAGECAAPKLLQYAFQHHLEPIAMAEFWWGTSPISEIRKHKHFYPACQSRCKPILAHMLQGMSIEENPLITKSSIDKKEEIIYEDAAIIVINKPEGFLSVPGKDISDSVYTRMKKKYPTVQGPLIVHRLDMCTSGILILTKTKEANRFLQHQFVKRTIKKTYEAVLDGVILEEKGTIDLPLRLDLEDRPRQLVCYEYGKEAITHWQVIGSEANKTRVHFYPLTGRNPSIEGACSTYKRVKYAYFGR